MIFKQERFLLMLTGPLVVLAAGFLHAIGRRSLTAAVVIVVALFATSIGAIERTWQYYRSGLHDLRSVASLVRSYPTRVFYGDPWAVEHVRIFTRYEAGNLRILDARTTQDELRHACVMLGGSRGVELLAEYVESTLPAFARQVLGSGIAPPEWALVGVIEGGRNAQRRHDLEVYCLP
jgi:hypothetical protein